MKVDVELDALGGTVKLPWDVREFFDSLAYLFYLHDCAGSTVPDHNSRSCSVPVEAISLDDLVQNPSIVPPAFHFSFGFNPHIHLQMHSRRRCSMAEL